MEEKSVIEDSFNGLRKRLLDQHFVLYNDFSKLLISLSAGVLALLAAMNEIHGTYIYSSALLLTSLLSGVFVQYRIVKRPLNDLNRAAKLLQLQLASAPDNPIELQRVPSYAERWMFLLQTHAFAAAFWVPPTVAILL